MSVSQAHPEFMPSKATTMFLARSLLCGLLVAAGGFPAAAQDASTKFAKFLCGVDLVDDSGGYNLNTPEFVLTPIEGGIVYTFQSDKLCTNSQVGENIKIDCTAKIPGWRGVAVDTRNVTCTVSGASCGIDGPPLVAINNRLTVDAQGTAVLTCQVK
jgi:hypothetical protein